MSLFTLFAMVITVTALLSYLNEKTLRLRLPLPHDFPMSFSRFSPTQCPAVIRGSHSATPSVFTPPLWC